MNQLRADQKSVEVQETKREGDFAFLIALIVVIAVGYFTYFRHYAHPPGMFWDENYHIPSAQKYLNGTFFMEPHPPLGKLLIAAGEAIVGGDRPNNQYLGTMYAKNPPEDFPYDGYRFFPALLGWLGGSVLFLILYELSGRTWLSLLLTVPYLFDNALITHTRGAMLEGPQIFFMFVAILFAVVSSKTSSPGRMLPLTAISGIAVGAAVAVKVNSLVLLLLPFLGNREVRFVAARMFVTLAGAALVYLAIWQIHFAFGRHIHPDLPDAGYFGAGQEYRESLSQGAKGSFLISLREHLSFSRRYTEGVPKYNPCKAEENGSRPYMWPFAASVINYRWNRDGDLLASLYLIPNPISWYVSLLALVLAGSILIAGSISREVPRPAPALAVFVAMYIGYMALVMHVDRVLYLYHYFLPLILLFVIAPLVLDLIANVGPFSVTWKTKYFAVSAYAVSVIVSYCVFRPLTYAEPLPIAEAVSHPVFKIWDIRCHGCTD